MTQAEALDWIEFYRLFPFDDMHRYHRPAALVARQMGGAEVSDLLEWLQPNPALAKFSAADRAALKAFGIKG